ncbi:MAG: hypothetical protein HYY76_13560 [Acidobacteria bacterium]|nr:hypothetical protein [Acidobacteriota bacterium]
MAQATARHEATPFRPPRTVTTATIWRLSGKLATDACRSAYTVDSDGPITSWSTAYTEYFARGTEPVEYCSLHTAAPARAAPVGLVLPPAGAAAESPGPLSAPIATTGIGAPTALPPTSVQPPRTVSPAWFLRTAVRSW